MKKSVVFFMVFLWMAKGLYAQSSAEIYSNNLPEIIMNKDISLHFVSPEPIQYVDISTHAIAGDLPLKNVLRLKIIPDSIIHINELSMITIVGESFIAQYQLRYRGGKFQAPTQINILPKDTRPLAVAGVKLTSKEMGNFAMRILKEPTAKALRKAKAFGLQAKLNHVFTVGDRIFLDITYYNKTNLLYQIDQMRFKIEDKKIAKATNAQSVEIQPVWQLYSKDSFKNYYRNIYVLEKFTFPGNKVLNIELTEKQISGRILNMQIKYSDILEADSF